MKTQKIFINGREYGGERPFIIAELGTSHGADPVKADELIHAAAEAGADCVKFQIVYAGEILHPNTGEVALPGGKIRLYDRFKELELPPSFFAAMKEKAEKRGLVFLCTPFGLQSARELKALCPACIKVASPELNYSALLKEIATYRLPVFLSTGVAKLGDIEEALSLLRETPPDTAAFVSLLHCVTAYPAPETEYNLRLLENLAAVFGVPVGVSDHSLDPELVPVLAAALGAAAIEKHFCLSRSDPGLDDPIALPPPSFARMVASVRAAGENGREETLAAMCRERGKALVESVLGDGVKRLAPSEAANYRRSNRSVHALRDIGEGECIEKDMIASLRTEKNLRPGLAPAWEGLITGRRARQFIPAGEGVRLEDV
ncbi:MAG: N-acetylneuraminate synthase family protein [Treponema sp.]|nr:N-acetylneuraminate synthase family protein [Treponema sp.]